MFGFTFISKDRLEQYRRFDRICVRLGEANRWLAELDWLLRPFWEYVNGKGDITTARDDMRRALMKFKNQQVPAELQRRLTEIFKDVEELNHRMLVNTEGQPNDAVKKEFWSQRTALLKIQSRLEEFVR